jgi:hypothetical protein
MLGMGAKPNIPPSKFSRVSVLILRLDARQI